MTTPVPVADGVPGLTDTSDCPEGAATVWFAGQVIVGFGTSITVTVNVQEPPPVVEVAATVVVPIAKNEPEAWFVFTVPQSPNVPGLAKVTLAPPVVLVATVMSFGHSSEQVGGVPLPPPIVMRPELAVLSDGFSSLVVLETLAMFVTSESAAPAVYVSSNDAVSPGARVARVQTTGSDPLHENAGPES